MLAPSVRSTLGGALKPNPLATLTRSSLCTSKIVRSELWNSLVIVILKVIKSSLGDGHLLGCICLEITSITVLGALVEVVVL